MAASTSSTVSGQKTTSASPLVPSVTASLLVPTPTPVTTVTQAQQAIIDLTRLSDTRTLQSVLSKPPLPALPALPASLSQMPQIGTKRSPSPNFLATLQSGRGRSPSPVPMPKSQSSSGISYSPRSHSSALQHSQSEPAVTHEPGPPPAKKKRMFHRELMSMMRGFGDDPNPYAETVDLIEEMVIRFITEMTHKAMDVGKNGRVQVNDIIFIIRKDAKKYSRVKDLLMMKEQIDKAKKAFTEDAETSDE